MIDTPHIETVPAQLAAVIHIMVPRPEIQNVMGPGLHELAAALAAQKIAPTGPFFAHHLKMSAGIFDFELGFPVSKAVAAIGRVMPGQLPAARLARTFYNGPYQGLFAAWGEFNAWVKSEGHTPAADLWEVYVTGPDSNPDPASWRTGLNRPLV